MAYIDSRSVQGSGLLVRLAYWLARRRVGRVPAPVGVMAHHPGILVAAGAFELTFERARDVDVRLKELALVKAASLVGCRFCIDLGGALAQGHGIPEAKLLALPSYETSPVFTPLERRVLDYTVQMTETPSRPDAELFRQLQAELGVRALVELTAAIAWENFRARFNHAVGAQEEGYSEGMVCLLPPRSGEVPARMGRHPAASSSEPLAVR
jgi:AhpD family alkylhydroperoxidase